MSGIIKRLVIMLAVIFSAGIVCSAPAAAQATRTWVSGVGDDANPCSRTAPCKTFAGAISKTAAGGEINCLDPAGFGTVTIVKSMTIDCSGTFGSALASSTTGFVVNGADANVILRGLSINGSPPAAPGINGVRVYQASSVLIENVRIFAFGGSTPNGNGVLISPSANPSNGPMRVSIVNSTISNNLNAGVAVVPSADGINVNLTIDRSAILNTGNNGVQGSGVVVDETGYTSGRVVVSISRATVTGSGVNGVNIQSGGGGPTIDATIADTVLSLNGGAGLRVKSAGATARVSGSIITSNQSGINVSGSALSDGTNVVSGNGTDGAFTGTITRS